MLNTLTVSAAGIVVATVIGFSVGIARVSSNWLLQRIALTYVEIVRNIPVILQVIFWSAVIRNLPAPRQAVELFGLGFVSNRGLSFAVPAADPAHVWMGAAMVLGIVLTVIGTRMAKRHRENTGKYVDMLLPGLSLIHI